MLEDNDRVDMATNTVPGPSIVDMKSKKKQMPSDIRQNVWCRQVKEHIKRLKELDKAPPEGCTVAHVLTQCEVDKIVRHGASVIHLTNPRRIKIQVTFPGKSQEQVFWMTMVRHYSPKVLIF